MRISSQAAKLIQAFPKRLFGNTEIMYKIANLVSICPRVSPCLVHFHGRETRPEMHPQFWGTFTLIPPRIGGLGGRIEYRFILFKQPLSDFELRILKDG
jgi:hypothetical protein